MKAFLFYKIMHYTYITTNLINNKKYIGQRKCPSNKTPKTDSYLGSGTALLLAINKYGKECFSKEIISTHRTQKETDLKEIELINQHYAVENDMFYNISGGGQFGRCEDHSNVTSIAMNNYYSNDYNYTNSRIKVNRRRIKQGLKPTYYTIAERDIDKLRKSLIKANDIIQRDYKRKVKRIIHKSKVLNTNEVGVQSWIINRDQRLKAMRKAWIDKKKDGYKLNKNHKRNLSITKLKKSGNYVGMYLIDNGMDNILPVRRSLIKLITNEYKDINNYIKHLKNVCKMIVECGVCIDTVLLHELVCDSREARGKDVYCV